jgi:uncharacterized protein YkwD
MRYSISFLLAAAVLCSALFVAEDASARQSNTARTASTFEKEIVQQINRIRAARGLRRIRWSRPLAAAATYHSKDMGRRGYFEHESANGADFSRRVERFYPFARRYRTWTVGENLYWGGGEYATAAWTVHEWMNSPPHRANILSRSWREVGIGAVEAASAPGVYRGERVTIVTANFGARR